MSISGLKDYVDALGRLARPAAVAPPADTDNSAAIYAVWRDELEPFTPADFQVAAAVQAAPSPDAKMRRAAILDAARQAVTVDRAATHGDVESTFGRIAGLWSALLGIEVTPAQVCLMLGVLKVARAWGNPGHADNWVDLAGYAACGGELACGGADDQA